MPSSPRASSVRRLSPEDLPEKNSSSNVYERSQSRGKRGPSRTSCFECRRRKLKCDEKVPCHQCIKRGVTHLCPNGHVNSGAGHRIFWDNTLQHHEKIAVCRDRIKDLEDALRSAHSVVSHEPHPLLSDELLQIKDTGKLPSGNPDIEVLEDFGSLSLSHDGKSNFYGHAATSWLFMDNNEGTAPSWSVGAGDAIPQEIFLSTSDPSYGPTTQYMSREEELQLLINLLPPQQHALELTANAFDFGFFAIYPIQRDEYQSNVYMPLYEHTIHPDEPLLAPRLGIMYALLAHGAQSGVEVNRSEGEQYLRLSCTAMKHSNLIDTPTIEGIQAVLIMSLYLAFSDTATRNTSNRRSFLAGFLMRLCQIAGLHSDPTRYELDPVETKRRRLLFAEVYMNDINQTLWLSRPPAITKRFFDVKPHVDNTMGPESHYHVWKYKFGIDCVSVVQDQAYSASPPSYSTVLALSHQIENYPAFAPTDVHTCRTSRESNLRSLQVHLSRGHKEDILLHIHRRFCLLATEKFKDDPLQSEYGASVASAYRSASRIISSGETFMSHADAHLALRIWSLWARLYDSATVLGTMVIRCPTLPFAVDAYAQLRNTCTMMHNVQEGLEAGKAYDKLVQTLDLAHKSLYTHANNLPIPSSVKDTEAEAVLANLGAKPQVTIRPGRLLNRSNAAPYPTALQQEQSIPPMNYHLESVPHPSSGMAGYPQMPPFESDMHSLFPQLPIMTEWDSSQPNHHFPSEDPWNMSIPPHAPLLFSGQTWDDPIYQQPPQDGTNANPIPVGMPGYSSHHEMIRQPDDASHSNAAHPTMNMFGNSSSTFQ